MEQKLVKLKPVAAADGLCLRSAGCAVALGCAVVLACAAPGAARAEDFSFELSTGLWASGETRFEGAHPGVVEPELDLSIGIDLSENTALTLGWRQLDMDWRGNDLVDEMSRQAPMVGLSFRF